MHTIRRNGPRGFTLIELLIVVAIIALISAVALPTVLPALNERRISESARLLQAILAGARDDAIRANAPRGIRLLPDPIFNGVSDFRLASNRIVPIQPGPDYTEGLVRDPRQSLPNILPTTADSNYDTTGYYLRLSESGYTVTSGINVPNNPTNWFNNIRQGDKIRFNDSGPYYTIAGPVDGLLAALNPERFIIGRGISTPYNPSSPPLYNQTGWQPEYLNLTNGQDDNGNGWIDESCDGIDNDGDGIIDPGFNGIDDSGLINGVMYPANGVIDEPSELFIGLGTQPEFEQESFVGSQASIPPINEAYTIFRRPVVSPGAREVTLPSGIVIDMTTWNAASATPLNAYANGFPTLLPERSRLPVDGFTGYVDIMIDQSGRVIPPGAGMGGGNSYANSPLSNSPFYHFWLTEREGVIAPLFGYQGTTSIPIYNPNYGAVGVATNYMLPMPSGTPGYVAPTGVPTPYLIGERRLVTLFVKTGQIVSNSIEFFNGLDTNTPFYDAQSGIKESQ